MIKDRSLSMTKGYKGWVFRHSRPADLIEVFKIFKNFDNIKYTQFFIMSDTGLRGHKLKIYKPQVHLDIRKYFFSIRIIHEWNSLPVELINCNKNYEDRMKNNTIM